MWHNRQTSKGKPVFSGRFNAALEKLNAADTVNGTAEMIAQAASSLERYRSIIVELVNAIELCLQCDRLTSEVEQEADVVCRKAKRIIGI